MSSVAHTFLTCIIQRLIEMDDAPVASLSLTHVHYVSRTEELLRISALTAFTEPTRSYIILIGMACSCSTGPVCHICDIDMGIKGSRDLSHVRRSDGM
jgi:hypothetical protein